MYALRVHRVTEDQLAADWAAVRDEEARELVLFARPGVDIDAALRELELVPSRRGHVAPAAVWFAAATVAAIANTGTWWAASFHGTWAASSAGMLLHRVLAAALVR